MATFGRWWPFGYGALLATLAAGCCSSMQRAGAIDAALDVENRERAEPSMRSAAERHGAALLPDRPQDIQLMPLCRPDVESSCVVGATDDGRAYRIRDDRGKVRFAVPAGSDAGARTRLARRGSKLLVLVPQVTTGRVTSRTACECDRMPRLVSATGFVRLGFVFFVDEVPEVDMERVLVPVTEDRIEWECKARLL